MVEYRTDEERVQLILDYFNQYKLAIISFLLFVIISVSGYFYVTNNNKQLNSEAYSLYVQWSENKDTALFDKLQGDYINTGFAQLALITRATLLANEGNIDDSLRLLYLVKENSDGFFGNSLMNGIARTNIARISIALGNFEDALKVLEKYSNDEDAYTHELKGDALSGIGNDDLALQQYQSAFEKYTDNGLRNLVQLKINNLNTNE